jgi:hypothetical protein
VRVRLNLEGSGLGLGWRRGETHLEAVIGIGNGAVFFVEYDDAFVDAAIEFRADLVFVEVHCGEKVRLGRADG